MKKFFVKVSARVFSRVSYIKRRRLQHSTPERFLSIREICNILDIAMPAGAYVNKLDFDKPLSIITAWPMGAMKGCMFVQFSYEDTSFADESIKNGATVILAEEQIKGYPCIIVQDTVEAYRELCATLKRLRKIPTIAITGSIGKTTTKEMVNIIFQKQYKNVFCNPNNTNMYYIIGHFIQLIPAESEIYIQESHEGNPDSACIISKMIEPDISIITNINNSHLENFKDENDLIKGVCDISCGMPENGIVIINLDNDSLETAEFNHRVITIGIKNKSADYVAEIISSDETGITFNIRSSEGDVEARLNIIGDHNVYNALLAYAAARAKNIPSSIIISSIASYKSKGVRQNAVKAGRNNLLYIDCYNASPKSVESAIKNLCSNPTPGKGAKRIAVLGNMEELGNITQTQHRLVGDTVSKSSIDVLITYGDKAKEIAAYSKAVNLEVYHATDFNNLIYLIKKNLKPGDAILLKASHSMNFERCISKIFPFTYFRHIGLDLTKSFFHRLKMALLQ